MKKKFITFGEPCITKNESDIINKTFSSKWLGTGPLVKKFETNFSNYKKISFSHALNSCTSALFLSLKLIGLKKGDRGNYYPSNILFDYQLYNSYWCKTSIGRY